MKCTKCKQVLRCTRCGTLVPDACGVGPESKALTGSMMEELRNRCVFVEVSHGVMRRVLLLSDVEDILARMTVS